MTSKLYLRGLTLLDALTVLSGASLDEIDEAIELGAPDSHETIAIAMVNSDAAWTVARGSDHMPVAVGGFTRMRKGVYRTWFIAKEYAFDSYGRELSVICARSIRNLLRDGAHRVETVSLSNRAAAHEWYERIGLTREAVHPGYGVTGQAAVTYVRIS